LRERERQGAIRSGLPGDATAMQEVEAQAGRLFAAIGMETVANEPPPELDHLRGYIDARNAWMFDAPDIGPVAYLLLADVDGKAHIEQMSVRPSHHASGRRAPSATEPPARSQPERRWRERGCIPPQVVTGSPSAPATCCSKPFVACAGVTLQAVATSLEIWGQGSVLDDEAVHGTG
jgi:hypothetical protein